MALEDQPLSIIENGAFRNLINYLGLKYTTLCSCYFLDGVACRAEEPTIMLVLFTLH